MLSLFLPIVISGGDRGIRTPDLRDANAALSQLSYIPVTQYYTIYQRSICFIW